MGTKERKEREKERRKDQIITAAAALIAEQGFEKTTMDEIAERSELSKGTLYLYFKDKATLYQAIKKRGLTHLHDEFLQIFQQDLSGAELVKKMVLNFLELITKNAAFTKSMVIYEKLNEEKLEEHSLVDDCVHIENELFMLIVRAIQIGIQDGSIAKSVNPKMLALTFSFQMSGMLQFYLSNSKQNIQKILQENELTIFEFMEQFIDMQCNLSTERQS